MHFFLLSDVRFPQKLYYKEKCYMEKEEFFIFQLKIRKTSLYLYTKVNKGIVYD